MPAPARPRRSTGRSASRSSAGGSGWPTPEIGGSWPGTAGFPIPAGPPISCSVSPIRRRARRTGAGPRTGQLPLAARDHRHRRTAAGRRCGGSPHPGLDPHPDGDGPANSVLGQPDFTSATEWPYGPHTGDRFRFPYAAALDQGRLAVADTANNRILLWDSLSDGPADHVLAQPDFASNGENRWALVAPDTLCWPYGLCLHGDVLAVADSGNNRVMLWRHAP